MSARSRKSSQSASPATGTATSSPASAAGLTLSSSPGGRQLDLFGREVAPASRSARLGRGKAKRTKDIYGRSLDDSSPSVSLQRSLESRLRAALDANGSLEYAMTWKSWAMSSGLPICALRARARPISDRDCFGWPTTRSTDGEKGVRSSEGAKAEFARKGTGADLPTMATLAGWPTPQQSDGTAGATSRGHGRTNEMLIGGLARSFAETEKPGVLNPAFSLWLMGFPAAWVSCGERAMRSCQRLVRRSSKRS